MLAPVCVDALQQHHPLKWYKVFNTHCIQFFFEDIVGCLHNHFQNFFVSDGRGGGYFFAQRQFNLPLVFEHTLQAHQVPLLFYAFYRYILAHQVCETTLSQSRNLGVHFGGIQNVVALLVDDLALVIGHVVVFKQLFARVKVARLYFALRTFNAACHHAGLNGFAFGHFEAVHDGAHAVTRKNAHEGIVQAQVKA